MTRTAFIARCVRRSIATAASAFAGLALVATCQAADADIEAKQQAYNAARAKQWRELMLAPAPRGPNGELQAAPATELPQLKPLALTELRNADISALLGADAPLDSWMPSLTYHFAYPDHADDAAYPGAGFDWLAVQAQQGPLQSSQPGARAQRLPDWVTPALRARIAAFKPSAARPASVPRGNTKLWWAGEIEARPDGQGSPASPPADALVWSGPAVKDGVARYTTSTGLSGSRTTIRLASWPAQASSLISWAASHGAPLTITLDESALPLSLAQAVPVRVDTAIAVWLVTPQELLPATLKTLRTGDACQGGGWIEVEITGNRQPAIWGTLFLPDPALGTTATARRLPAEKQSEGSSATQVSRVEVSWPDRRLSPLLISAKQFASTTGSIWGTQADVLVVDNGQPTARRLSGSGKPACGI